MQCSVNADGHVIAAIVDFTKGQTQPNIHAGVAYAELALFKAAAARGR